MMEGENDQLKQQIRRARETANKKRYYQEEIQRMSQEINLNRNRGDNSSVYNTMKTQINDLNQEKQNLLEMINKNKTQIKDIEKDYHNNAVIKKSFNNEILIKELE